MKYILIIILIIITLLFYPVKEEVIIIKSEISSIKPFAGLINDQRVGTEICCNYWLSPEKQPDTVKLKVTKPFGISVLGYIYKVNQ